MDCARRGVERDYVIESGVAVNTLDDAVEAKDVLKKSFIQAGPWAVLCIMVLGAIGYEGRYFIESYVKTTTETMRRLADTAENTVELVRSNGEMIKAVQSQHAQLSEYIRQQQAVWEPVAAERQEQTALLREIKAELEQRNNGSH